MAVLEIAPAAILVQGVIFLILFLPQAGADGDDQLHPYRSEDSNGAGIGMFLAIIGLRRWDGSGGQRNPGQPGDTGAMDPMASGAFWAMIGLITIAVLWQGISLGQSSLAY